MSVLPGDGGVCDALRYVRRGISASLDGQEPPAGANRNAANNLRGSSGCRSRPASTRNMALSAAPRQSRHPCGEAPSRARGQGAPCAVPRALAGRGLALGVAPNCGLGRLCAYKDMRRCPVKHFQDFPRNPKTLGHAAQQQNKLHLGTRKPSHSPQPTAHTPHSPRPRHRFANPELYASKGSTPSCPSRVIGAGIRSVFCGIIAGIKGPLPVHGLRFV